MNKTTSQPHLTSNDLDELDKDSSNWLSKQPENQQIQQFKVVLRNLPHIQRQNWQKYKWLNNKGVQSLSNLECIVENSLETDQDFENNNFDSIDFIDSSDYIANEQSNQIDQFNRLSNYDKVSANDKTSNDVVSDPKLNSISTISNSNLYVSNQTSSDQTSSNLNKTNKRSNYQSNLNHFNNLNSSKHNANYKQVNSDDNFFFGPANQDYESRMLRDTASRNRKIAQRQNFCDWLTIFLILTSFISILVAIILLFLIALDAWEMQTTFTIVLILLCIMTVLLVLFASFTGNFYWFYNSNSNSIDWMLHYGRKNYNNSDSSNYYFGKSFKDEENNDTESSLIEQI